MINLSEVRQRVIQALNDFYREDSLDEAMSIWDMQFAHGHRFSKRLFALALCRHIEPRADYDALLESLNKHVEFEPAPARARSDPKREAKLEPARSFAVLLAIIGNSLRAHLEKIDVVASDTTAFDEVFDLLTKQGFSIEIAQAVNKNLHANKGLAMISLSGKCRYQTALNCVYIVLCSQLGPVTADHCLSEAIKKADSTESGQTYSASNFL